MSAFPDELISALVAAGFYVLRTDHRDSGQSDYEAQHSGLVPRLASGDRHDPKLGLASLFCQI